MLNCLSGARSNSEWSGGVVEKPYTRRMDSSLLGRPLALLAIVFTVNADCALVRPRPSLTKLHVQQPTGLNNYKLRTDQTGATGLTRFRSNIKTEPRVTVLVSSQTDVSSVADISWNHFYKCLQLGWWDSN